MRNIIFIYLKSNRLLRKTIRFKLLTRLTQKRNYHINNRFIFRNNLQICKLNDNSYIDRTVRELYIHYMNHEYNFLGTGWVNWNKRETNGDTCGYKRISWKKDVISGYEYNQRFFRSDLIEQLPEGVDIKIVWELGRMYHWPQLAVIATNDRTKTKDVIREFVFQMDDFMETNPIGEGVQFYCPMETAIRAINLLFTYDCLLQIDETGILTVNFKKKLEEYLYLHGNVISCNLEYDLIENKCGNHYLSDLCGLLWIYMYFDAAETKRYCNVLKKEFFKVIQYQFLSSGCNFECSSGYHKLTAELSALGFLAISKLDPAYQNQEFKTILKRMASVLMLFRGIDGRIIQIGDNDSGSVFKLKCFYESEKEDTLRVENVYGLLCRVIGEEKIRIDIPAIIGKFGDAYGMKEGFDIPTENVHIEKISIEEKRYLVNLKGSLKYNKKERISIYKEINFKESKIEFNKEFGLIRISTDNINIFIRTIPDYLHMELAHVHDDVFHWEIVLKDKRIRPDSGSYVYTPDRKMRTFFASSSSHNVPVHANPIIKRKAIFAAETSAKGKTYFDDGSISLLVITEHYIHIREFVFKSGYMDIFDYSNDEFSYNKPDKTYYSLGYGQLYEG